jgi:hypothetical protein
MTPAPIRGTCQGPMTSPSDRWARDTESIFPEHYRRGEFSVVLSIFPDGGWSVYRRDGFATAREAIDYAETLR